MPDFDVSKTINVLCGVKNPTKFDHFYSITPTNFMILSDEKQLRKLGDFFQLLRILQKQVMITLTRTTIMVPYKGKETRMDVLQVLVDSTEPLDDVLEKLGFSYTIDESHQQITIEDEHIRSFSTSIENSQYFGRAYTLYKMPTMLPPAWIHSIFSTFHKLQIHIAPVRADDAMKKIDNKELLYIDNKSGKADLQKKLNDIKILKHTLELGNTSVFEFTVNGFIFGKTKSELLKLTKEVQKNLSSINVRMTSSMAQQKNIINGGGVSFLGDVGSLGILYPFASADMLETPNGIFLGTNKDTNGPIIYDPDFRKNHNIYGAGTSGSGKSFTFKILLKRFLEKHPNVPCIYIDPQAEAIKFAKYFGLDSIELKPGTQYGLDPFKLFETKIEAVDVIGSVTNAPNEIRKEWRSKCDKIDGVKKLYEQSSPEAKKYLVDLVKGPIAEMLKGETKFSDRMIISFKDLDGQEYEGLMIFLTLTYAWKRANKLPSNQWKIIFCDEAWKMKSIKASSAKVGEIAREIRKISGIFGISTQTFSDLDTVMDDGSRLTELFDTKIIMQMSQTAARNTGKALDLTNDEIERIINFKQGNGMLQTFDNTIYAKFEATEEETKTYFNTKEEKQ